MAMNREELRDELRGNVDRTTGGVSDARLNTYINWSQQRIADQWTFEEMRRLFAGSVTDGVSKYGFPTLMKDIFTMRVINDSDSRTLTYVPAREFDQIIPRPATYTEDTPNWYVDYGINFEVFPIPDQTYDVELRCSLYPAEMDEDTDESELLRKDKLIICGATIFALYSLKEYEEAAYWSNEIWTTLMAEAQNTDHSAEDWTPAARPFRSPAVDDVGTGTAGKYWQSPWIGR